MNLPIIITENLSITGIEGRGEIGDQMSHAHLFCQFYGKHYVANISAHNVEKGWQSITAEGPGDLFESFVDQVESEHWDRFTEIFLEYKKEFEEGL